MGRATTKNIEIRNYNTQEHIFSIKKDGVLIDGAVSEINYSGDNFSVTKTGTGTVRVNMDTSGYKTVTSIPSYMVVDSSKARGSVTLTGGAGGSVDSIEVDGVELLSSSVDYTVSLTNTAIAVLANLQNNFNNVSYTFYRSGTTIYIISLDIGTLTNGYTVVSSSTLITTSDVNMSGGVDTPYDFSIIKDNRNATYDILDIPNVASLPLSLFGGVGDLEYLNVTTDGTTAVILSNTFDQTDVGKKIRIKDGHQNPDVDGPTRVPNTTLGRIVTVSAEILSVVDGVSATIDFIPNRSGVKRSYMFTNNTEAMHKALRYCQYKKIQELSIDVNGILGFDLYDKGLYASETSVGNGVYLSNSGIRITSMSAKLKATNEFDYTATGFFNLLSGDNDFYLDVPILPADEFGQDPQKNNKAIVTINGAVNSIRTITVKNQKYNKHDFDDNDAWWNKVILGDSTGGRYSAAFGRESQVIVLENNSARCKNGSYTNFQNDGYSNEMYFKDVHFNDTQHYTGENGRSFQPDNTLEKMNWQYNNANFSVASNVVTTTEPNFSWYDHQPASIAINVTINGQSATIASITDAKTAVLNAGIGDISNQNCLVRLSGRTYFDHPMYIHPSMICHMARCKSNSGTDGNIKMYSDGGSVDDSLGIWYIYDCTEGLFGLETLSGGTTSTACITRIYNSKVEFYSISGYCYVKDCEIKGKFIGHELVSLGGNTWGDGSVPYPVATINDDNLNHYYNSTDKGNFQIKYIGANVNVVADGIKLGSPDGVLTGATLPMVENGTLILRNITVDSPIMLSNMFAFSVNTNFIFENFKTNYHDGTNSFLRTVGFNTATWLRWENSRYYANYLDANPINFDETGINVGKFNITRDEGHQFYGKRFKPNFTRWWAYKELEYFAINLTDGDYFIVKDFSFSCVIATFLQTRHETLPAIGTGETQNASAFTYNVLPLFKGEFKIRFEGTCVCSPYHHTNGAGANNSSLRENTTLSNMVVKSLDRVDGEIVTFKVDPIDGRVIETNSSVKTKYVSSQPTRLGVVGEKLYKDDGSGQYWEHEIDFADDSTNSYAGTQANVAELNDIGGGTQTNTHIDITGTPEWSIGQEKTDGNPLLDFDFTLNINGGGTLEFEYETTIDISGGNKAVNAHYNKYLWQFKQTGGSGYRCFMNNRTGQIVFNGVITETLDAANIITINSGNKITRREWVLKGNELGRTKISLNSTEIKNLGTTPIDAIEAPGTGKIVDVISAFAKLTWNSVAFDDNPIIIRTDGAGNDLLSLPSFVNSTADNVKKFDSSASADDNLVENTKIVITGTDSTATGDSTVDVYITYKIVTL